MPKKTNTTSPATEKDVRVRVFEGHEDKVRRVAMPADGRFALTTSDDGTVRKWDFGGVDAFRGRSENREGFDGVGSAPSNEEGRTSSGIVLAKSRDGARFCGVAVSGDGELAAAGDAKGRILLLNPQADESAASNGGAIVASFQAHGAGMEVGGLSFCRFGEIGAGSSSNTTERDRSLELHSVGTDEILMRWDVGRLQQLGASEKGATESKVALVASCQMPFKHRSYGLASSANASRIVGACIIEGLAVWSGENESPPQIHTEKTGPAPQIGLTSDGRFAFVGTVHSMVAKWDLELGKRVAAFEGHSSDVRAVAVTPNGRFCVSGSDDRTVRLWDVETGQCLAVLQGHVNLIYGIAVSPDGRRIASTSIDETLRVWDIPGWILDRAATAQKTRL